MLGLPDIVALLNRWDLWKRIEAAPARLDELEKRLASLEAKLGRAPGEACPSCGDRSFRVERSEADAGPFGELGARNHYMKCSACGFTDVRMVTPK